MSEAWSYTCINHEPNLHSDEAATGGHGLERMRELYARRTDLLAAIATLQDLDFDVWNFDPVENVAVRFFRQHPTCRLAATSDANGYLEMDPPGHAVTVEEPRRLCEPGPIVITEVHEGMPEDCPACRAKKGQQ